MLKRTGKSPLRISGFTLIEALVVFSIMAVIMAVMAPIAMTRIRQSQLNALESTLEGLQGAVINYKADVTKYPARLQLLMNKPTGGNDACAVGLASTNADKWRGPYISLRHPIPSSGPDTIGITMSDWYLADLLIRTPSAASTTSSTARFEILISGMRTADATYLNTLADGLEVPAMLGNADTAGTVRWTGITAGLTTSTTYGFVIGGC